MVTLGPFCQYCFGADSELTPFCTTFPYCWLLNSVDVSVLDQHCKFLNPLSGVGKLMLNF